MTYWRLHYHLIWAKFERQPLLTIEREKVFYRVLYEKAKELDIFIHAAGNVDDHVHVVVSIPPKLAVARVVKNIKGTSAFAINHMPGSDGQFQWQEGYGALSISEISLETVKAYASEQKAHHKERTIHSFYERIEE